MYTLVFALAIDFFTLFSAMRGLRLRDEQYEKQQQADEKLNKELTDLHHEIDLLKIELEKLLPH
jgi:hypothetical protein